MAQVIVNTNEFYKKKSFKNTVIIKDTPLLTDVQNQQNKNKKTKTNHMVLTVLFVWINGTILNILLPKRPCTEE